MRLQLSTTRFGTWTAFGLGGAALLSSGCTLVGLAVGTAVDARSQKRHPPVKVDGVQVARVAIGTSIAVVWESGERIEGKYAGVESAPRSPEYDASYVQAQARLSEVPLPTIGQRLVVSMQPGRAVTGVFEGFEADSVLVHPDGQSVTRPYRLREATSLSPENRAALPSSRVQQLIAERRLPVLTRLVVGTRRVPFDRVRTVEFRPRRHSGKRIGAALGLVVDAAVVVWARSWKFSGFTGPLLLRTGGRN